MIISIKEEENVKTLTNFLSVVFFAFTVSIDSFSIGIGFLMCLGCINLITGKNYLRVTKDLSKVVDGNTTEESSETSSFNDILYPLYIPKDTYLTSKETINTDNGNRAILTFGGAKDFVLVEEASNTRNEFEVIPIYGEPLMMNGTIGALSGNAIYWTSNNVDYYLAGSSLTNEELLSVANSISNTIVTGK